VQLLACPAIAQLAHLALISILPILVQGQTDVLLMFGHPAYLQIDIGHFLEDKTFVLVIPFMQQVHLLIKL
jgi:hypothetical protein